MNAQRPADTVQLRLLGPLELVVGGKPVSLGPPKQRALLAQLAIRAGEAVPVERLIDELWPQDPPETARHAVQVYVSALRKAFGERSRIEARSRAYALRLEAAELDLGRFRQLVAQARRLEEAQPADAAELLSEAMALWRGRALADLDGEPGVRDLVLELEELRLQAFELHLDARLAAGASAELVPELERLIAEHPARERLRGQHMLALYRAGRQADALEAYQRARQALLHELGLEPSGELRQLEQAILRHDPALTVEPAELRARRHLPAQPNAFIGRARELGELVQLIGSDRTRLVTLTGPGGVGKTRLALEAAHRLAGSFRDGVWFVDLSALHDAALVPAAAARALRVEERGGAEVRKTLAEHLRDREALLVVDNFEHLHEAAPELSVWLREAPRIKLLVTSRELLNLYGEHAYQVQPLEVPDEYPDPSLLEQSDAAALFLDRGRAARTGLSVARSEGPTVSAICRTLDGLPLALELAAARLRSFGLEELLERLAQRLPFLAGGPRDLPDRQQTLRATIEWSYALLGNEEQRLLARLAVFAGGWTLEAADAVCEASVETLQSLVQKSLVRQAAGRHSMLETIREFAAERLRESDERARHDERHADHFSSLAEARYADLRGPDAAAWLERFSEDHDNFRAALRYLLTSDPARAVMLAGALSRFWIIRGHLGEGRGRLEEVLKASDADEGRSRALRGLAILAMEQGDVPGGEAAAGEALAVDLRTGDDDGAAQSRGLLADVVAYRGDLPRACELYEESIRAARRREDDMELALSLYNLGQAVRLQGDLVRAEDLFDESLAAFRRVGDVMGQAGTLKSLVEMASEREENERAFALLREATELFASIRYVSGLLDSIDVCAGLFARVGDSPAAARLWGARHALDEEIARERSHPLDVASRDASVAEVRAALGDAQFEREWNFGSALTLDEAVAFALAQNVSPAESI